MKLPRDLSGAHLVTVLCRDFGYHKVHQVGCHVILDTAEPRAHRLAVPDHNPLRLGTLNAILRAVAIAKGIDKATLLSRLR
jgi:predicted RNA binding protein YcfA (HicA-like mRNA interferase family)